MAGLTPVSPGSKLRISASDFNACLDAARAYRFGKRGEQDPQTIETGSNIILVRNDSGSDCDELSVLGLDVPVILPTENLASWRRRLAFSGIVPTADHAGKFCVLQEPIASGSIGRAIVSGVFQCVLNVADEDDTHADAAVGVVSSLSTGTSGSAKIVWKESGTGEVYGVVSVAGSGSAETPPTEDGTVWCSKSDLSGGEWVMVVDIGRNATGKAGKIQIISPDAAGVAIELDAALVTASTKKITVREIDACVDGEAKKMLVLASEPYSA